MVSDFILLFCSGLTFAVGGINLAIGSVYARDRSYTLFGLLSLLASLYLFLNVYTTSSHENITFLEIISVTLAISFYTIFIWFIGEYTGYRKREIQRFITFLAISLLPLLFLVSWSIVSWKLWEVFAHITILLIGSYGFIAGRKGLKGINKLWQHIFILLISILIILTILFGSIIIFEIKISFLPEGFISPPDFFPVFFSIVIGSKMSHDIFKSYQLDKELDMRERRWGKFMEKINLLVLEFDLKGRIIYVNSYFSTFTDFKYEEVVGKEWSVLMKTDSKKSESKTIFENLIKGEEIPAHQNLIYTKNGDIKYIHWSILSLADSDGKITGMLSIGSDVTEREASFEEIKQLKSQLEKENLLLKDELHGFGAQDDIIGESDSLQYGIKRSLLVAETDSTVLLEGETGVGKELFANLIQRKSNRNRNPYIQVNCSAIPKELIESEFFGHEKGAFTGALKSRQGRFELADKGTIFLDEVGEIPYELQAKLLRVLQTGEFERIGSEVTKKVNVRIIAATNKDLGLESQKGSFRLDLYYRLNVYPITIPPLRQRKEDIPLLVRHFVDKIGRRMGKKTKEISKADLTKLSEYSWPGNVRELENIIERAIINSSDNVLRIEDDLFKSIKDHGLNIEENENETNLSKTDRKHIIHILEKCKWKINGNNGAAQKLGIPPSTLRSKMKKLNISRPE
jgi:PAS domain S-box-containing protein